MKPFRGNNPPIIRVVLPIAVRPAARIEYVVHTLGTVHGLPGHRFGDGERSNGGKSGPYQSS